MIPDYENNVFKSIYSFNIKGKLIDFATPKVMGIINLTSDSFYAGSRFSSDSKLLKAVEQFISDGADFIDIGALSSRPTATFISEKEEAEKLLPVLSVILKEFPETIISIDTFRSSIVEKTAEIGASIINDISAGKYDDKLFATVAKHKLPYVLMHMQGDPKNMQQSPQYKDISTEIFHFFTEKLEELKKAGVQDVILDPGFGFGKNLSHNYSLLKQLHLFHFLNCPVLAGLSRKGMIQQLVHQKSEKALNGTTVAHTIALLNGANILRVHDVKEAKEAIEIVSYYQKL